MDSVAIEINVEMAAGEDFSPEANANPYQTQSVTWGSYEPKYEVLIYQATGGD